MDQATLVKPDTEAGLAALNVLDAAGIEAIVAAYVVFPEYEDWKFVLASPALDQTHQLKAYEQVTRALDGNFVYNLPLILILSLQEPFIQELRQVFGKAKSVKGMRLGGQTIGNRFIADAYVYRIR